MIAGEDIVGDEGASVTPEHLNRLRGPMRVGEVPFAPNFCSVGSLRQSDGLIALSDGRCYEL